MNDKSINQHTLVNHKYTQEELMNMTVVNAMNVFAFKNNAFCFRKNEADENKRFLCTMDEKYPEYKAQAINNALYSFDEKSVTKDIFGATETHEPIKIMDAYISKNEPSITTQLDRFLRNGEIDSKFHSALSKLVVAIDNKDYPAIAESLGLELVEEKQSLQKSEADEQTGEGKSSWRKSVKPISQRYNLDNVPERS